MMAMTMKGSVYIIGINEKKKKKYEKNSISNSSIIEYQHQQSSIIEYQHQQHLG
jgi:hypothetical protein